MARLQILELPEGGGDDRPPFVLVIDEVATGPDGLPLIGYRERRDTANLIGARAVLVFDDTIDIPANDTSAFASSTSESEWTQTDKLQARATEGVRLAHERTDIARDMDRLAQRRDELAEALGMDRTRDWDDIRNAAVGIRRSRDSMRDAIERVRDLHRPVEYQGMRICAECSAYDGNGSCDNSPAVYDQCTTTQATRDPQTASASRE